MRLSIFPLLYVHLLCLLCPALGQGTADKSTAESLFALGTPLFSNTEQGETSNLLARWIPFDDISESAIWTWDNSKAIDVLGVVMTDQGVWAFKIDSVYQRNFMNHLQRRDATSIYGDDEFFNKIAYPLFGHTDSWRTPPEPPVMGVPSRSQYALSEQPLNKMEYQKAFIISAKGDLKGEIAYKPLITALAWTITHTTGLQVQWLGQDSRNKKRQKHFVLHLQPTDGSYGSQNLEIFDTGKSLLKAEVLPSILDITHYDGFEHDSFPALKQGDLQKSSHLEALWSQYPRLTKDFGYEKDSPRAQRVLWNLDLKKEPTIFRHFNTEDQRTSIIILVVTTRGFWSLALSKEYLKKKWARNTKLFESSDEFLALRDSVLKGPGNSDSWESAADLFANCLDAVLIDIVILSGYTSTLKDRPELAHKDGIKAILFEMMKIDTGGLLHDLEERGIRVLPFPANPTQSRGKNGRFILQHYTSPDLIDHEGNFLGSGEWMECYYGATTLIQVATWPSVNEDEPNHFKHWSDVATSKFLSS